MSSFLTSSWLTYSNQKQQLNKTNIGSTWMVNWTYSNQKQQLNKTQRPVKGLEKDNLF